MNFRALSRAVIVQKLIDREISRHINSIYTSIVKHISPWDIVSPVIQISGIYVALRSCKLKWHIDFYVHSDYWKVRRQSVWYMAVQRTVWLMEWTVWSENIGGHIWITWYAQPACRSNKTQMILLRKWPGVWYVAQWHPLSKLVFSMYVNDIKMTGNEINNNVSIEQYLDGLFIIRMKLTLCYYRWLWSLFYHKGVIDIFEFSKSNRSIWHHGSLIGNSWREVKELNTWGWFA